MKMPIPQVFLSYTKEDKEFAKLISDKLEKEYLSVWRDQDNIHLGDNWKEAIDEGIKSSFLILVLLSPASYKSTYVTYEWAFAMGLNKKIIPLLLEPGSGIHPKLNDLQYQKGFDFSSQNSIPWQKLTKEIERVYKNHLQKENISEDIFNRLGRKGKIILFYRTKNYPIDKIAEQDEIKETSVKGVRKTIKGIPSKLEVQNIREAIYLAKALELEHPDK